MANRRPRWTVAASMLVVALCAAGLFAYRELERRRPVNQLVEILRTGNAEARKQAARVLGEFGRQASDAAPALVESMLGDPDEPARQAAIAAIPLVLAHDPAAAEAALRPGLRSDLPRVRLWSGLTMARLGARDEELMAAMAAEVGRPELSMMRASMFGRYPDEWLVHWQAPADPILPILREQLEADSPHFAGREFVVRLIARMAEWTGDDPRLSDALVPVLDDSNGSVVRTAAAGLATIGPNCRSKALDALERKLRDRLDDPADGPTHRALGTILALEPFGQDARAVVPALVRAIESEDPPTRLRGLYLLGRLGTPGAEAAPTVVRAITEPDASRPDPAEALLALRGPSDQAIDNSSLEADVRFLEASGGPSPRSVGLQTLERLGPEAMRRAITTLAEQVKDLDSPRGAEAVEVLGLLGPKASAALPALIERASSRPLEPGGAGDPIRAVGAVGMGGDPRAVGKLAEWLGDEQATIRESAARALARLGSHAEVALSALLGAARSDPEPAVRALAAEALGRFDVAASEVAPTLLAALDDPEGRVRVAAAGSLAGLGPEGRGALPKFVAMLRGLDPLDRRAAIEALGGLGPNAESALPDLVAALGDDDPETTAMARRALDAVWPVHDLTGLSAETARRQLRSPEPFARRRAAADLARLDPDPDAIDALRDRLKDDDPEVRAAVAAALGRHGGSARPAAVELIEALDDPGVEVRLAALGALPRVAPESVETFEAIRLRLNDPSASVRQAAALALGRLGSRARTAASELAGRLNRLEANDPLRPYLIDALRRIEPNGASEGR